MAAVTSGAIAPGVMVGGWETGTKSAGGGLVASLACAGEAPGEAVIPDWGPVTSDCGEAPDTVESSLLVTNAVLGDANTETDGTEWCRLWCRLTVYSIVWILQPCRNSNTSNSIVRRHLTVTGSSRRYK